MADKITLGAIGVEVNQVLTWNPLFGRPELRGPISFNPGKPLRADTGFVHYGGSGLTTDFHNQPYIEGAWDAMRSTKAAWRILSNVTYPPYSTFNWNGRFLPYNPYGTYAVQLAISRTMNQDPELRLSGRLTQEPCPYPTLENEFGYAGEMYVDPSKIPEEFFVHYGGANDLDHRVKMPSRTNGWLMKFDRPDYFDQYIAPLIDRFYQDYPNATGAPAIFVDNCPGTRTMWCPNPTDPNHPEYAWEDHFDSDEKWFAGWQQVFRRIKSQYPNLRIYANWVTYNPDNGADKVLELVDHILFENFYAGIHLRFNLAFAYRAQKLGKGVTFASLPSLPPDPEPTLADYNPPNPFEGDYDFKQAYFCVFLLTWGENTLWGGQWNPQQNPYWKIHDMAVLQKWFGVPSAGENGTDMWEMRPDLWTRNFVNAKVFLNLSVYNTYTIPLSEAFDEYGNPVTSITLKPYQGQFVFRQPPLARSWENSTAYWRQLPSFWRGTQAYPYSISCDAIVSSLNLGVGATNENWVSDSEDLTAWNKSVATVVTRPTGAVWNGIQMNEIKNVDANDPFGPEISHHIDFGSPLASMYVTVMFYAQQIDDNIDAVTVGVNPFVGPALYLYHPLRYGDYPQLIVLSGQLGQDVDSSSCVIVIRPTDVTAKGSFRVGAVRVTISPLPDNLIIPIPGSISAQQGDPLDAAMGRGSDCRSAWWASLATYQRVVDPNSLCITVPKLSV